MFFRMLNDEQKRGLLVLAYHLVLSDHTVSQKEGAPPGSRRCWRS